MIILDTNVVSEMIKPNPSPSVMDWMDEQLVETLYLTSISVAELLLGIELLPAGKRQITLRREIEEQLLGYFEHRILHFNRQTATAYASLVACARSKGCTISALDGQIAAIATANRFTVATRDTSPFIAMEVSIINPWEL